MLVHVISKPPEDFIGISIGDSGNDILNILNGGEVGGVSEAKRQDVHCGRSWISYMLKSVVRVAAAAAQLGEERRACRIWVVTLFTDSGSDGGSWLVWGLSPEAI